jgi:hypothetical protein
MSTPAKADTIKDFCKETILTSGTITVKYLGANEDGNKYNITTYLSDGVNILFDVNKKNYDSHLSKYKEDDVIELRYDIEQYLGEHEGSATCIRDIFVKRVTKKARTDNVDSGTRILSDKAVASGRIQGRYDGWNPNAEDGVVAITLKDGNVVVFSLDQEVADKVFGDKAKGKQVVIYYETWITTYENYVLASDVFKQGKVIQ